MPKNFKKLLVCIVATFGMTAMVFSCCKKIGLAASSGSSVINSYPLPLGLDETDVIDFEGNYAAISNQFGYPADTKYIVFVTEIGSSTITVGYVPYVNHSSDDFVLSEYYTSLTDSQTFDFSSGAGQTYYITTDLSGNSIYGWSGNWNFTPTTANWVETSPSGSIQLKNGFKSYYPVASNMRILFNNNSVAFGVGSSISGHTKGGVLSNYIDSDDLIEDSSDLPKVDTSAPSNSSSIPDWLHKILNAIGRVNQSIQGGVLTIGDYIGSMTEKISEWFQNTIDSIDGFFGRVEDKLDDIIDSIEGLFDGTTVSQAQTVWEQEFNNSIFKNFVDLKATIETDILTPIKNANAPSTLSFTIPLITVNVPRLVNNGGSVSTSTNNVYLFGQSVTLDFSWYTRSISGGVFNGSSIRDYLVPIIATFLYVGMVVHLLFKIPSFLNGSSGFSSTLHSVVVSNNGSKLKKA